MRSEIIYQRSLIRKLNLLFPGCFIMRNDPSQTQGILDILILFNDRWAMLETKKASTAAKQPNQEYYVDKFGEMSFASFISPQTEEQVLNDLQLAFGVSR